MNIYMKNSCKNLLPLSEDKEDFKEAVKEWFFTGAIVDYEAPTETCELCEKDEVRYQYEIKNGLNNTLWVGSKCIDKFDITVFDENGNEVTEKKEYYLQKQARKQHIINVFKKLDETKPKDKLQDWNKRELDVWCINQYNEKGKLNPKIINYLFLRLDEEGIFYDKRFFAVNLNSHENKRLLANLETHQFERIKKALSPSQQKYYKDNKKSKK